MIFNWAACGAAQFIKWVSFFCQGGGGGVFLGSRCRGTPSALSNLHTISEQYL